MRGQHMIYAQNYALCEQLDVKAYVRVRSCSHRDGVYWHCGKHGQIKRGCYGN